MSLWEWLGISITNKFFLTIPFTTKLWKTSSQHITLVYNMHWGQHILEMSSKATKTLGFLRMNLASAPRSTKEVAYKTLVRPKLEYAETIWSPYSKLQIYQVEKVQRATAGPARDGETQCRVVSARCLMCLSGHLLRPEGIGSPLLFHKIHCGAVSIEKDKYLTPAHSLKSIRPFHSVQCWRYQTYSCLVILLWIFYVFVLSHVCYVFVRVCLFVLCGHLLGKGWLLGSRLRCLTVSL